MKYTEAFDSDCDVITDFKVSKRPARTGSFIWMVSLLGSRGLAKTVSTDRSTVVFLEVESIESTTNVIGMECALDVVGNEETNSESSASLFRQQPTNTQIIEYIIIMN